jgi:hypothetical protein
MTRIHFMFLFGVVMIAAFCFQMVEQIVGPANYDIMSMGLLSGAVIMMIWKRPIGELTFWLILTFVGRSLDGMAWGMMLVMLFVYLVFEARIVVVKPK